MPRSPSVSEATVPPDIMDLVLYVRRALCQEIFVSKDLFLYVTSQSALIDKKASGTYLRPPRVVQRSRDGTTIDPEHQQEFLRMAL